MISGAGFVAPHAQNGILTFIFDLVLSSICTAWVRLWTAYILLRPYLGAVISILGSYLPLEINGKEKNGMLAAPSLLPCEINRAGQQT